MMTKNETLIIIMTVCFIYSALILWLVPLQHKIGYCEALESSYSNGYCIKGDEVIYNFN